MQEPKQRDTIPSMTHFHNIHTLEIMSKTQEELFFDIKQTFLSYSELTQMCDSNVGDDLGNFGNRISMLVTSFEY